MTPNFACLARLFSADSFRVLAGNDLSAIRSLLDLANVPGMNRRLRLSNVFDKAFEQLKASYRCEYVYKNILTEHLVLGRHVDQSEPVHLLTEFWVGEVRADLAVFNGTSTVYEVKTDLDSLSRLPQQIRGYSQFFDQIYVVTSPSALKAVRGCIPEHVGILVLNEAARLEEAKKAQSNKSAVHLHAIFRGIRELEALDICRQVSGLPLDVPNGLRPQVCWEIFSGLTPQQAHDEMVSVIRARKLHAAQHHLLSVAPSSLKHLCIGKKLTVSQYRTIALQLQAVV